MKEILFHAEARRTQRKLNFRNLTCHLLESLRYIQFCIFNFNCAFARLKNSFNR